MTLEVTGETGEEERESGSCVVLDLFALVSDTGTQPKPRARGHSVYHNRKGREGKPQLVLIIPVLHIFRQSFPPLGLALVLPSQINAFPF
jgi:hypothetical protein